MDKHKDPWDKLGRKVFENISPEMPSEDFVAKVARRITELEQSKATVYRPLITKKGWLGILLTFGTLLVAMAFYSQGSPNIEKWWSLLPEGSQNPQLNGGLSISKVTLYGLLAFTAFFFVQIPLLKKQYERHLGF